jgi:hypothetical protein
MAVADDRLMNASWPAMVAPWLAAIASDAVNVRAPG